MELNHYLDPFDVKVIDKLQKNKFLLGNFIKPFSKSIDFEKVSLGIVGITEERVEENKGAAKSPNIIRKFLYELYSRPNFPQIIDFGDIKNGKTLQDTEFALHFVLKELLSMNIFPIVLGSKYFSNILFKVLDE
jgi:hypothetical protein